MAFSPPPPLDSPPLSQKRPPSGGRGRAPPPPHAPSGLSCGAILLCDLSPRAASRARPLARSRLAEPNWSEEVFLYRNAKHAVERTLQPDTSMADRLNIR